MLPDDLLAHMLRLRAAIDCALAADVPVSDEDVHVLVQLFDELDVWLRSGGRPPRRWSRAFTEVAREPRSKLEFSLDVGQPPSNDNCARRRRPRVRHTRSAAQLALPWSG